MGRVMDFALVGLDRSWVQLRQGVEQARIVALADQLAVIQVVC